MKHARLLGVVGLVSVVLSAGWAGAEPIVDVSSRGVERVWDSSDAVELSASPLVSEVFETPNITFNITYQDLENQGFKDPTLGAARKGVLEDVLDYVAGFINETGTLDVLVFQSWFLGTGEPVAGGTSCRGTPGWHNGFVYERLTTGVKPLEGTAEIRLRVDWAYSWYLGSGTPGPAEYDLFTVLLKEVTHTLGIFSLSNSNGTSGAGKNAYSRWDNMLETGTGIDLFVEIDEEPQFNEYASPSDLLGASNGVVVVGPQIEAVLGGPAQVYAPSTWRATDSLGHFATGSIPGGAVLEYGLTLGLAKRTYSAADEAALLDIGYLKCGKDIAVLGPIGGEEWTIRDFHTITWASPNPAVGANVRIGLESGGTLLFWIVRKTANDGAYTWKVPDTVVLGSDYRIRVQSYTENNLRDSSPQPFSIVAAPIYVSSPTSGLTWAAGATYPITWETNDAGVGTLVRIALHKGGGFLFWINRKTDNDGEYNWVIPDYVTAGNKYKIRVQSYGDADLRGYSDGRFSIEPVPVRVISPNGGELWMQGEVRDITWQTNDPAVGDFVRVGLHAGGVLDRWLALKTDNDGVFSWAIPVDLGARPDYKIRVQSYTENELRDFSNADFVVGVVK
ncbi:MAG TPA: Ser-Thr-rich GPI-anchored membrane family protein [Candidatus Hydrogenedentes bacterium]|nr:Ser-Thr-rich GPI-anchored membrane family protein [Candidatus Hydrogenedentota bacterium]HPG66826.1 Ser-Thr-rich GPI-anchored membrane family protein [Candidatus Hydrogenedentota bacterium]